MRLAEIQKNSQEKIVVELSDYGGKTYFNVRIYFQKDGEWIPTKKGVNLNVENLEELKTAIAKAEEHLNARAEIF